jgi:hypothetical protein
VIEAVGQWNQGANPSREPLRMLVIDLVEKGAASNIPS